MYMNVLKFPTPKCLTKWHLQTVQTQIRKEQSDQGLHCGCYYWEMAVSFTTLWADSADDKLMSFFSSPEPKAQGEVL